MLVSWDHPPILGLKIRIIILKPATRNHSAPSFLDSPFPIVVEPCFSPLMMRCG